MSEQRSFDGIQPERETRGTRIRNGLKVNYDTKEVVSALVKELRRGSVEDAMYWAFVLYFTRGFLVTMGYLVNFGAEDLDDPALIAQLGVWYRLGADNEKMQNRHFIDHGVVLFCQAAKKWETERGALMEKTCHETIQEIESLSMGMESPRTIPSYALDAHTSAGYVAKKAGHPFDIRLSGKWEGVHWRIQQVKEQGQLPEILSDADVEEFSNSYKMQHKEDDE